MLQFVKCLVNSFTLAFYQAPVLKCSCISIFLLGYSINGKGVGKWVRNKIIVWTGELDISTFQQCSIFVILVCASPGLSAMTQQLFCIILTLFQVPAPQYYSIVEVYGQKIVHSPQINKSSLTLNLVVSPIHPFFAWLCCCIVFVRVSFNVCKICNWHGFISSPVWSWYCVTHPWWWPL